ncbi:MAG TPA: translational GTPase TypA [Trueperaceae bacterium]|nr:translational GTPase TypA [Trueperaceae bacterium]
MNHRNVAIIAHVDHGKTTLVDGLLRQSHVFRANQHLEERVMDTGDIERERGITILAKNTAVEWQGEKINIVDTPGHADFGGEVERALTMVDSVLLLVDAAEGPMPQTRFVLRKALARGLKPIVVINKVDRRDARPDEVASLTFDLMVDLGADDDQLDFPIVHAIAREGRAWLEGEPPSADLAPLFQVIHDHVPLAKADENAPFRFQVANLDYSDYLGRLALGRVLDGTVSPGDTVVRVAPGKEPTKARITKVYTHLGLNRIETEVGMPGDIIVLSGLDDVTIGDTLCHPDHVAALPAVVVDEPTVSVTFSPNTSPFAGREGTYVTSRHLADRLERELLVNVALRVEPIGSERYRVSGRGELHLSILVENMRREGYEFGVSRPEVIMKDEGGRTLEPFELATCDIPNSAMGGVMESLTARRGVLVNMDPGETRSRLEFRIPSRSLFGYRNLFLSMTQGEGLLNHTFDGYEPFAGEVMTRNHGSLVSMEAGEAFAYSLYKLEDRGIFFIDPGTEVYVGMIVGANARMGDLDVNVCKNKKLTNVRASGSDDNLLLTPRKRLSLEEALEYLDDDELLEVTPKSLRLRKRILDPNMRKKRDHKTLA